MVFLDSSQLTTSIHWSCYCIVHVYAVISFLFIECGLLSGSQSVQVFHYLFMSVVSGNGIPFTGLTPPPFCSCPKKDLDFQRRMSWSFCVVWVFFFCGERHTFHHMLNSCLHSHIRTSTSNTAFIDKIG